MFSSRTWNSRAMSCIWNRRKGSRPWNRKSTSSTWPGGTCAAKQLMLLWAVILYGTSCVQRPVDAPPAGVSVEQRSVISLADEKEVDLLFVIDNSSSMTEEQVNLARQFPRLIEALRSPVLDNQLPSLRIGVVSTDLGAGPYTANSSCEVTGGDGARLQHQPRVAGCTLPADPWIAVEGETTNIPGGGDPLQQVKETFSCIAQLGASGCGFEQPLDAARRALDPNLAVNPGFLRQEALLAVIFITDEDDCSAENPGLFDPLNTALGPPRSFRCVRHGLTCMHSPDQPGPWEGCKPGGDWLYDVQDYVNFFQALKPQGRVVMAAIAGPAAPVEVGLENGELALKPSCSSPTGSATPALRLQAVVQAFGDNGQFNADGEGICSQDFGPALQRIGERIRIADTGHCLPRPPLTQSGVLACELGTSAGDAPRCEEGCLAQVDCVVDMIVPGQQASHLIPRCAASAFAAGAAATCGAECPCWRVMPSDLCSGSPFAVEVLTAEEPAQGSLAEVRCSGLDRPWSEVGDFPRCAASAP